MNFELIDWTWSSCLLLSRTAVVTIVILLAAIIALRGMARLSAAVRHRLWLTAIAACWAAPCGLLLMPAATYFIPSDTTPPPIASAAALVPQEAPPLREPAASPPAPFNADAIDAEEFRPLEAGEVETAVASIDHDATITERSETSSIAPSLFSLAAMGEALKRSSAWILGAWCVIAGGLVLRLAWQMGAVYRLIRRTVPLQLASADAMLVELRAVLRIKPSVELRRCGEIDVPMIAGFHRPIILLPDDALTWSPDRMRAVLQHELAHVARGDLASQLAAELAAALLWFQPLLRYAARRLRIEREFACDDLVLQSGTVPCDYAGELLEVAARAVCRQTPSPAIVSMAGRSTVEQRIRAILNPSTSRHSLSRAGMAALAAIALLLVMTAAMLTPTVAIMTASADEPAATASSKGDDPSAKSTAVAKEEKTSSAAKEPANEPSDTLAGQVVDEAGTPVADVQVKLENYTDEQPTATTDAEGRFAMDVKPNAWKWRTLVAQRDDGRRLGTVMVSGESSEEDRRQLKITLAPAREIVIRVVDGNGRAVPEAMAGGLAGYRDAGSQITDQHGAATLLIPKDAVIQDVYAMKESVGMDYKSFVLPREMRNDKKAVMPEFPAEGITLTLDGVQPLSVTMLTTDGAPIPDMNVYVWYVKKPGEPDDLNLSFLRRKPFFLKTDADGRVVFDWIPRWQKSRLTIWPQAQDFTHDRGMYDPATGNGVLELRLERLVPLRGKVVLPDGSPAAGIAIDVAGAGYSDDDFRRTVKSQSDGTFEVNAEPNKVYLLVVKDQQWGAEPVTGFPLWPNQPVENLEFRLRPATRLHGRVTIGPEHKPVQGKQITSYQYGADANNMKGVALPNPEKSNLWVQPKLFHNATTDADGYFELSVGSGKFDLRGPNQNAIEKFEITDETEKEFNFHMPRAEKGILKGLVVTGDPPRPVAGAKLEGICRATFGDRFNAVSDDQGRFEVERPLHPAALHVESADRTLGALLDLEADDAEISITLQSLATATGKLVDAANGGPLADREIRYGIDVHEGDKNAPFQTAFGGVATTDDQGVFTLQGLVPGGDYRVTIAIIKGQQWRGISRVNPQEPGEIDLGEIPFQAAAEPRPQTLEGRIAAAFKSDKTPLERFAAALPDAKLSRQRILILLTNAGNNAAQQFMKLRLEDDDIRAAFDDFRVLAVNSAPPNFEPAKLLAEQFDRDLRAGRSVFYVVVADADGQLIDEAEAGKLMHGGVISQEKLLAFLKQNTLPPLDAKTLWDDALATAKAEKKRVIVQETATWCGPCWMLSRFLDQHRDVWSTDYVWVKMDHRWTGAQELMKEMRDGADGGVPWWAVLDADGKILITSNTPSGENIGFPSAIQEIDHFRTMLEQTAQRMTKDQIDSLVRELKGKK